MNLTAPLDPSALPSALAPALALLVQQGGADIWQPVTKLLTVGLFTAAALCWVVGGLMISSSPLDHDNRAKGYHWVKYGTTGFGFGVLSGAMYQLFVS